MISPIAIATRGRISPSKKQGLTLLTQGRIVTIEVVVIIPNKPKQDYTVEYIAPGGGGYNKSSLILDNRLTKINRVHKDDNEILLIIKIFLECQ